MSACKENREKLGEFLVGALDPRASDDMERHIERCRECSAELAELQRLEGVLWSAEPDRAARPGVRWRLAAAAAVLIAAGVAGVALVTFTGGPRLVDGEVADVRADPGPLPLGRPLWITRSSRIVIPGVASIDAAAGARVLVHGDRAVRLDAGEAFFGVEAGSGGFSVETPLGTVEVPGTSFGIEIVEEGKMSNVVRGAATAAVIVSVASGAIIWKGLDDNSAPVTVEAGKVGVARPGSFEVKDPATEARQLEDAVKTLRAEHDSMVAGTKELERRLSELSAEAEALRKTEASKEAEESKRMRLAFGSHADMEVLQGADWAAMGEASMRMTKLMEEIAALEKPFEEAPQELLVQLGIENAKLVPIALELAGKLPSHTRGNGEFTHPIVHWNILAEALERAGAPLSEKQLRGMASLGEEYDAAWETLQGSYGDDTLAVEKVLDELELKKRFRDRLEAILEPRQREVLGSSAFRHRMALDLYSPLLMLAGAPTPDGNSREQVRAEAIRFFESAWKIDLGGASNAALIDGYLDAAILQPVPSWREDTYTYDEAMAAGRAQAKLMRAILESEGTSDEAKQRIRESGRLAVPRLTGG